MYNKKPAVAPKPSGGPGKKTAKEKIKKDPKTGREYSVADKGMSMKKTLKKIERPVKTKAVKKSTPKVEPKSKDTTTQKPLVIKEMSQAKIDSLKADYTRRTGKAHISKDEGYNKLRQTLKRAPTIAEFNRSLTEKKPTEMKQTKDTAFLNLKKKLGRLPTVAEYNKSQKK